MTEDTLVRQKFNTLAEVKEYLSMPRIECLVCHRTYKSLSVHLWLAHGITTDEYKETWGIPWGYSLNCQDTKKKKQPYGKKLYAESKESGATTRALEALKKKKHHEYRRPCAAVKNQRHTHIMEVLATHPRHPMSAEAKHKISLANKGRPGWSKGRKGVYSQETLDSISRSQKQRYAENPELRLAISRRNKGRVSTFKGKQHTPEARALLSERAKERFSDKAVTIDGATYSLTEAGRIAGVGRTAIANRIKQGISGKDLLAPNNGSGRFKNIPADEIKRLYESGVSCAELVKRYGMSRSAVYRKAGVVKAKPKQENRHDNQDNSCVD